MMKITPYWWFNWCRNAAGTITFSDYVKARYALTYAASDTGISADRLVDNNSKTNVELPALKDALDWNYGVLNALDTKASALMRLNGVMLAAAAFLLKDEHQSTNFAQYLVIVKRLIAGSCIGSTISIACCLLVVSVDWPFLGLAIEDHADNHNTWDFKREFFHLGRVVTFRQRSYRLAWAISMVVTIAFVIAVAIFFVCMLEVS